MTERVFGGVRFIRGENNGKYPYCHSLYIEEAGVLIDPASDRERLKQLKETSGVKMVWLTHWHEDHITDLDLFDDVPLCVGKADALPLSDIDQYLDAYEMVGDNRERFRATLKDKFHFTPRIPDRFLEDGETIDLGSVTVEVISTPGHTPGHMSFLFKEPKVLFLGDYDLTRFGPWYGDRDSDVDDVISSVEKLRQIPASVWIAGHETGIFEEEPGNLWDRYVGVIQKREDKLMALLETPKTLSQIIDAGIVYRHPGTTEPFFLYGE
jgi:hydroxyacylglutathione hydrolase